MRTDFKLRYQGSVLGYLWSLLRPLALFTILYIVFSKFLKLGASIPHYPAYLLLGIVVWTYFQEASMLGLRAIVDKGELIRKTNVPKFILVLSTSFSAFVNLIINLVVFGVFLLLSGAEIHWGALLLPLILIELLIFSGAVSFFLAALYVKFRDISYIWEVMMQLLFYATPIIYPLAIIPTKYQKILLMNPLAQMIQYLRSVMVTSKTPTTGKLIYGPLSLAPFVVVIVVTYIAVIYFRMQSRMFAEEI